MAIAKSVLAAASMITAAVASPAAAQLDDLQPEEIEAATKYALPIAFDSYRKKCAEQIRPDGYVALNEERLELKFAEAARAAWPEARAVLLNAVSRDDPDAITFLRAMPDENLKPFVDGIFENIISEEIKVGQCGDIERGLELLDPLPVENLAGLLGFIVELDNRNEAKRRAEREAEARSRESAGQ